MVEKIGIFVLMLISCGALYLLDFFIKQDQVESSQQNRQFFKQTHDAVEAKSEALKSFRIQLIIDLDRCKRNASKTNLDYLEVLHKYLPKNHRQTVSDSKLNDDIVPLLNNQQAECKALYDTKLQAGI